MTQAITGQVSTLNRLRLLLIALLTLLFATGSISVSSSAPTKEPNQQAKLYLTGSPLPVIPETQRGLLAANNLSSLSGNLQGRLKDKLLEFNQEAKIAVSFYDLVAGVSLLDFNGHETFTAASTYKIYAAASIFQQIEDGSLDAETYFGEFPVLDCVEITIKYSDNDCVEAWLFEENFSSMAKTAKASGAKHSTFEEYDIKTTANDLISVLQSLYAGKLLSQAHTKLLLSYMEEQIWMDGIPAGWGDESKVFNKPGFLDEVHNDAAIIYSPKGDFALVIMTETDNFSLIAKITKDVFKEIMEYH
ncbi:MAG TPA: serine hydrolase [Microbacteriaceae bacterium]|nr:serine hydrolase [Microbacteriaceae bacterium]